MTEAMVAAGGGLQYRPDMNDDELRLNAFARFDVANREDPNQITVDGVVYPKELLLAKRLTDCVLELNPDASEVLLLASRCQHLCRWEVPRSTEPMGREGYLKWRAELKQFHAEKSGGILRDVGFPEVTVEQVQALNLKKNLKSAPDCQTLEDALCLIFLKYQFDALIASTDAEKMVRIVQKTWVKMSDRGRDAASKLSYSPEAQAVLAKC